MRASPWSVLLRAISNQHSCQPCHSAVSRRFPPQNHVHTSLRTPPRGREGDQAESVPYKLLGDAQTNEDASAEAEETAEDGPDKPPKPKDRSNYGSASRRAGRNIKKVKELPPVHIPPWFLSRNIVLLDAERQHSRSAFSEILQDHNGRPQSLVILGEELPSIDEDQDSTPGSSDQDPSKPSHDASSDPPKEPSYGSYRMEVHNSREIFSAARAGLQVPSWQRAETVASQKPHLLLFCPRDGASSFFDWLGTGLAATNRTDFLRLSPQDIAEIGGDYLDEPSDFRLNTMSSLGYDAPLVSAARHATPSEDSAEEEDYDDYDDGEGSDHGELKPVPFQRAAGGAFGIGAIHIGALGGNLQDVFKSMMPASGSSQSPKPMMMAPVHQQPKDMTPELKLNLLVETLLNTPEIKRVGLSIAGDAKENSTTTESSGEKENESQAVQEWVPERQRSDSERGAQGLVVLISDYPQINTTINGSKFLDKLHEAVENRRKEGQRILIVGTASSQDMMPSLSKSGIKEMQDQSQHGPIRTIVTAIEEPFNGTLDRAHKEKMKKINIRHLRDMLRRISPDAAQVAQIVVDWELDLDSKIGFISGLDESVWPMDRVNRIATTALGLLKESEALTSKHIETALQLLEASDSAKFEWVRTEKERKKSRTAAPGSTNQQDSKERIRKLRKTCNDHEKKLLNGVVHPEDIRTNFSDVQAPPTTIDALKTLTSLSLVRPDAFTYGVLATDKIPGLLLYGPPGTGKTLLARAVAKESGATVLEVSGSDVYDMYVGEGEKNVRAIFSLAKKLTPCIVFIDEADAILGARSGAGSNRTSHRELINQFLREWDGMNEMSAFIMVATNRPFDLDEASLRRLPRRLLVDLPVEKDREAILKIHLKGELLSPAVSLPHLASQTPFYSGSDLKNVCVAAALACVREEFDAATTNPSINPSPHTYPPKRTLHPHHFAKAMEEISASISEDMGSLSAIRKFDEKYGDRRGRRKKGGYGFRTVAEGERGASDAARVRNQG